MMKTRVKLGDKYQVFDLTRPRSAKDLEDGEPVLAVHPDWGGLCLGTVEFDVKGRVWIREVCNDIAPLRWCVSKRSLKYNVYIIN